MNPSLHLLVVGFLLGNQKNLLSVRGSPEPTAGVIYAAAPKERGAFHVGGKGVYNYGYNTGDGIAKVEVRHQDGSVTGSYRYFDPLGRQIVRTYIADNRGFRVLGNELPVAPDTPAIGILEAETLTGPVEGTQEFSTPNLVTEDERSLLLRSQVGSIPVSRRAESRRLQELFQQKNALVRQQQDLINQQESKLAQLKLQQQEFLQEQQRQIAELKTLQQPRERSQQTSSGYYNLNNIFGFDSPYFYAEDRRDYDFPAGFAYHANPVYPVEVRGESPSLILTAGHTNGRSLKRPDYRQYTRQSYRHPYIIGKAK